MHDLYDCVLLTCLDFLNHTLNSSRDTVPFLSVSMAANTVRTPSGVASRPRRAIAAVISARLMSPERSREQEQEQEQEQEEEQEEEEVQEQEQEQEEEEEEVGRMVSDKT